MASTCGSAAACSMNRWTLVENGVVRVVDQDVALAEGGEDAPRCLAFAERGMGGRNERSVLQLRLVQTVDLEQCRQVEQTGHLDHVGRIDVEFTQQQLEHVLAHVVGHFGRTGEPNRLRANSRSSACSRSSSRSSSTSKSALRVIRNAWQSAISMPGTDARVGRDQSFGRQEDSGLGPGVLGNGFRDEVVDTDEPLG